MKFSILSPEKHGPRLGLINSIQSKSNMQFETPMVLLHTQGGHIPYLTHEVFKLVTKSAQILQIPLVNMHKFRDTIERYNGTLSQFIGSTDSLTCMTLNDPSATTKQGHHLKDKIPIFPKDGKFFYDAEMYMNVVEKFKPDMYYLLSDGDTNKTSLHKRVIKAVDNTISLHRQCIDKHKKSEILKKIFVMAPVAGAYCLKSREKCIHFLQNNIAELDGFLIDGLHNNGPEVEFLSFDEIKDVIQFVIKNLPKEKMFSIQGCWNPLAVVRLVGLGIDIFDTSYCHIVTERASALTFAIGKDEVVDSSEIDLRDSKYAEDFTPLMASCTCLSCVNYTRSYIHHLTTVHELLGPVLLMIHNVHHYLRYFENIRKCISDKTIDDLESRIAKQYKNHQCKN